MHAQQHFWPQQLGIGLYTGERHIRWIALSIFWTTVAWARLFPDSRLSNRWSTEALNNAWTKLFSWCTANRWNWIRFDHNKKKLHKKPAWCSFETNSRLFIIFLDLNSIFQVWKIAGQISRLFQEFNTLHETLLRAQPCSL